MEASLVWDGNAAAPAALKRLMRRGVGVASVSGHAMDAHFTGHDSACVKLVHVVSGEAELITAQGRQVLQPGHLALLDPAQPARLRSSTSFEHTVAFVPRPGAALRQPAAATRHAWRAEAADAPLLGLLRGWRDAAAAMPDSGHWVAGTALAQLLRERSEARPVASEVWLARQARALVALEIATITPERLARQLRLSRRRLDQLLARQGTTATRLIWHSRLDRAAGLMRQDRASSITTIAHDCGFKDSSHFSRLFRQAHGQTPSDWRARLAA